LTWLGVPPPPRGCLPGRNGMRRRAYSHVTVRLRELDFDKKLAECRSRFQKERWEKRKQVGVRRGRSSPRSAIWL
jgi:hypothetical protein